MPCTLLPVLTVFATGSASSMKSGGMVIVTGLESSGTRLAARMAYRLLGGDEQARPWDGGQPECSPALPENWRIVHVSLPQNGPCLELLHTPILNHQRFCVEGLELPEFRYIYNLSWVLDNDPTARVIAVSRDAADSNRSYATHHCKLQKERDYERPLALAVLNDVLRLYPERSVLVKYETLLKELPAMCTVIEARNCSTRRALGPHEKYHPKTLHPSSLRSPTR
eukprot:m.294493 g.294493  ORF g.294493 m.294493 type:complete len:225 (+) comp16254_c0_seq5:633-1307(+)